MRRLLLGVVFACCWSCSSDSRPSPASIPADSGKGASGGTGGKGGSGGSAGDSGAKDGASDAPPGDAAVDADGSVAECNTLTPDGPAVAITSQTGTPPVPAGGTIAPGKYWLTERTRYPGATASSDLVRRTLVIDAKKISRAEQVDPGDDSGAGTLDRSEANYTIYGLVLSTTGLCPAPGAIDNVSFTASSTELWLFLEPGARDVYTLK